MNKYDVEYNRLMRKMERGGSIDSYAFKIDTPTGAPTKLSYIQQLLVRTTNFKAWFGDWEKASRVYIETGKHAKVIDGLALVEEVIEEKIVSEVGSDYDKNVYDVNNLSIDAPFLTFDYEDEVYYAYKNVSKVLDIYTLEPRVVYHGTRVEDEFYTFRTETRATGRPYAYFAYNREYSQNFVKDDGTLYECFLNVRDPYWDVNYTKHQEFEITLKEISNAFRSKAKALNIPYDFDKPNLADLTKYSIWAFLSLDWAKDEKSKLPFWYILSTDLEGHFKSALKSNGYDGVMFGEEFKNITEQISWFKRNMFTRAVVIFESNQVKLADGRNVDFFGNTTDIRYDDGGRVQNTLYDVLKNYTDLSGKQYFYKDGVFIRIKDHLAKWSNFESYNMDLDGVKDYYILSIVIADDPNNALLRESDTRVEKFINDNEDDFDDLIAREYIYSPNTSAESIISDVDYYISKMSQGKRNFANGGALQNKEIMLPDTNSKYAHLKSVLQKQGFDIYPSIKENQMEKFEVGGTIKHEKGTTTDGKKGGYFEGRSHADGGIKAFNVSTNTPIEVEGGEVIITKKAVDDDDLKEFEGEMLTNREILSRINQGGGGVAFEDGGEIHSCNCSGNKFAYGGETIEDYEIIRRLQSSYETKENMKNHKIQYGHNLMRKMKQGGFI